MGEIPEPEVPKPTPEPSSWLSLRVFYLRLSRCEVNESMLDNLTITHSPLTSDTVLEVNGDRPSTNKNGHVSCPIRRDRVDAASREATFVSTANVRMAGSVRFEVRVGSGEKLLVGIMEMCDVAEEKKGWVMKCQVAMQRGSGFLKAGGEEAKSPMVEVYVASLFRGNPVVFTKAMKLRLRRTRQVKAPFMEPIPECGEHAEDAKETPPDEKHDPQESEYRCYRPEPGMDDVGLDSLYMGSAGLEEDEDSELSWFTTGVRVGVGNQPGHLPRGRHRGWAPGALLPVHLQGSEAAVDLRPALTLNGSVPIQRSDSEQQLCFSPNVLRLETLDVFVLYILLPVHQLINKLLQTNESISCHAYVHRYMRDH